MTNIDDTRSDRSVGSTLSGDEVETLREAVHWARTATDAVTSEATITRNNIVSSIRETPSSVMYSIAKITHREQ